MVSSGDLLVFLHFNKGDKFCDFQFAFQHIKPLLNLRGLLLKKIFAPKGSKSFPFRVDPFSDGRQNNFDEKVFDF